ncbi:MAG: diguanylate cyclase [Magnetococcales bacterium]|nr:diguanylate cyclase [Magnetococcales bacterium]MBF0149546.1 diguanylate cyclase [Magnetococcales bacterium]MBF0173490.1 diguanylate cyclase [Magnetococcales bacterium]
MHKKILSILTSMNLKEKTTFLVVTLSGAMILMLAFVSLITFREFSIATAKDHVRSVAEVIRVSLTESMINGVINQRDQFLKRLAEIEGFSEARVIRGPGVIQQFGSGLEREQTNDAIDQEVLKTGKPYFAIVEGGTIPIFRGTIPFVASNLGTPNCLQCHQVETGQVLGVVTIHLSMEHLRLKAIQTIGIMLIIVVLFALFFALFFRRQITPVVQTAQGVQHVVARATDGDFSGKIDYRGKDEMGLISRDLNRLMQHLQINLGAISHDISRLIRYEIEENSNLVTTTTEMVETLLEVAQFKQAVEEDQTTQEVYFRISQLLTEKFGVSTFSIYEVLPTNNHIKAVMVDGDPQKPACWCNARVMFHADSCRTHRTGHVIDSFDNRYICSQFNHSDETKHLGHICIPVFHSGQVGMIIQIVAKRTEGPVYQFLLPFIRTYLRESSPTVEAKRLLDTLRESALRDALTGLHNRRFLKEYEDTLIATTRRKNNSLSILMMDLDHFKHVNDTYGHDVGDTVLKALAKTLSAQVRTSDIVIRYGGEEFMVILQENFDYTGPQLAEKIRVAVEKMKIQFSGGILQKTISIGVAGFPADGDEFWDVVKAADLALYAAKKGGRNRWVQYDPKLAEQPAPDKKDKEKSV